MIGVVDFSFFISWNPQRSGRGVVHPWSHGWGLFRSKNRDVKKKRSKGTNDCFFKMRWLGSDIGQRDQLGLLKILLKIALGYGLSLRMQ
jgi:hypothetical protein